MKKLTISIDADVYDGLRSRIGPRRISRFLNGARPSVPDRSVAPPRPGPSWRQVFGPAYVEQDRATRLFLYRGDMQREWQSLRPSVRSAWPTRFVAGINAYIDLRPRLPGRAALRIPAARLCAGEMAGRGRGAHPQPRPDAQPDAAKWRAPMSPARPSLVRRIARRACSRRGKPRCRKASIRACPPDLLRRVQAGDRRASGSASKDQKSLGERRPRRCGSHRRRRTRNAVARRAATTG